MGTEAPSRLVPTTSTLYGKSERNNGGGRASFYPERKVYGTFGGASEADWNAVYGDLPLGTYPLIGSACFDGRSRYRVP